MGNIPAGTKQSLEVVRSLLQEKRAKLEKCEEKADKLNSEINRLESILETEH
ncbi:MAG: hypothetical protein R2685_08035 [Candidatus Nitrosocosmicus sp.]|nr:hypothetical protein [Candidatus Nitrosocosmicus sp.]